MVSSNWSTTIDLGRFRRHIRDLGPTGMVILSSNEIFDSINNKFELVKVEESDLNDVKET